MTASSDDEWEETTMTVELNGVLDAQNVRDAIQRGQFALRRGTTDAPILQIGNGLYTGKWQANVGTDLILQLDKASQTFEVISVSDRRLVAEKALLTQNKSKNTL